MLPPGTKCLIYVRFSTDQQAGGDSITRQTNDCEAYAKQMGWETEVAVDEGKSAFHGVNRVAGSVLGEFEREAKRGERNGWVLLVERLDRLSRRGFDETHALLNTLSYNGVSVATLDGPRLYKAGQPIEFGDMVELLVKAKIANDASADKQRKLKSAWKGRREAAARGEIISKTCPPWLALSPDRKSWVQDQPKVELIRRMFAMADSGLGSLVIARTFNEERVPVWPRYAGKKRDRTPSQWDRTTIGRHLSNEAVIGDLQFFEMEGSKRVRSGPPVRGYYPEIVAPEVFRRVNLAAASRKAVSGGRSKKGAVVNIASTLTKCAACGSSMAYISDGKAGKVRVRDGKAQAPAKVDYGSLICRSAHQRSGCTNRSTIAYVGFERSLLDIALHLSIDDRMYADDDEVGRLAREIADAQRNCDIARERAEYLFDQAGALRSDMALRAATKAEAELRAIEAQIVDLQLARDKAAGAVDATESLSRLTAIREELYVEDFDIRLAARSKVAQGLHVIIDRIDCCDDNSARVHFRDGVRFAVIKPGRGRRAPEVWNFDLSKPGDQYDHITDPAERAAMEAYARRNQEARDKETA